MFKASDISYSIDIHFFVVPTPASIALQTSEPKFIIGADITFICTVELNSAIVESDLSLLMMDVQLSRDGTPLTLLTDSIVTGTTFTYTTQLNSFGRCDSGNYTCTATVEPRPTSTYLTRSIMVTANISITAGMSSSFATAIIYFTPLWYSYCTPCGHPTHSVQFLWSSGG